MYYLQCLNNLGGKLAVDLTINEINIDIIKQNKTLPIYCNIDVNEILNPNNHKQLLEFLNETNIAKTISFKSQNWNEFLNTISKLKEYQISKTEIINLISRNGYSLFNLNYPEINLNSNPNLTIIKQESTTKKEVLLGTIIQDKETFIGPTI